ncbi:pectinesterase 2-like [Trifolium medium]|uniref:Pectinesterase 2-like n=1 Tax=Trifolium medium TaxID=97028 RepID=A0A392SVI4_9FABA|nr:pectinesterase 2-like [Trifolium medium]
MDTYHTFTVAVDAPGFIARDITFRNTAGPENHQAVALLSNSNTSVLYDVESMASKTVYVRTQDSNSIRTAKSVVR